MRAAARRALAGCGCGQAALAGHRPTRARATQDLVYPADAYGNNCGEPGTPTATMGKVIFPALDTDIIRQLPLLAAQQYWLFRPTKMCATACPAGFSLKTPVSYGGPTYPSPLNNTAGAVPSFW